MNPFFPKLLLVMTFPTATESNVAQQVKSNKYSISLFEALGIQFAHSLDGWNDVVQGTDKMTSMHILKRGFTDIFSEDTACSGLLEV